MFTTLMVLSAVGLLGTAVGTGLSYASNSALQEDSQKYTAEENAITREYNAEEAEKARQFSHDEAVLARNWEEQMDSTAYQRKVADMKAAGINPAVAASGISSSSWNGNAASASVASAHNSSAGMGSVSTNNPLGSILSSAITATALKDRSEVFKNIKQASNALGSLSAKQFNNFAQEAAKAEQELSSSDLLKILKDF